MQINGKSFRPQPQAVTIKASNGEEVILTVTPLPVGYHERDRALFPEPIPPSQFVVGHGGKVMRDPSGKAITEENDRDPGYQAAMLRLFRAKAARLIYVALRDDATVAWDAAPEDDQLTAQTATEAYAAIADELESAGFGPAQLLALSRLINEVSGNTGSEAVEAAIGTFRA